MLNKIFQSNLKVHRNTHIFGPMNIKQPSIRPPIHAHVKNSNILAQNRYSILRSVSKSKNNQHSFFVNQNGPYANTFHAQNTQNYHPQERLSGHLIRKHRAGAHQTVNGFQDYQKRSGVAGFTDRQSLLTQSLEVSALRGNQNMRPNEPLMLNNKRQLSSNNFVNCQNKMKINLFNREVYRNPSHNSNSIKNEYRNQNLNVNQNINSTIEYFDDNQKSFIDDFKGVVNVQVTKQDYARVFYQKMAFQQCLKKSKAQIAYKDEIIKQLQAKISIFQSSLYGNSNECAILNKYNSSEYRKSDQSYNGYQFQWRI